MDMETLRNAYHPTIRCERCQWTGPVPYQIRCPKCCKDLAPWEPRIVGAPSLDEYNRLTGPKGAR